VIRGEAGVGKSALLRDARERAGGMRVLGSRGVESETQLAFAGVHQLLRPVLDHIDALPDPQATALRGALGLASADRGEPFLISLAVLSLLAEIAEHEPVLCLIDDAHWLDDASADVLVFVARRLEAEGIVMLFSSRDGEVRRFDAPGLPELRLAGLDVASARALLGNQIGLTISPAVSDHLITGTGGNPLALIEVPLALTEKQLAGTEPLLDPLPVSTHVEHAFLARLRRLPGETQTALLVAAAEDSGDLGITVRAARELGAGPEALDPAEQAGLIEVRTPELHFRHPLVRSAIYHGAPLSKRQAVHAALAAALDGEADADRRAWHRAAASVEPDHAVAEELDRAAGRALERSGFAAASLAFERAASLSADDDDRARRLVAAGENAWFAGRPKRAMLLFDRARPIATDPIQQADANRGRGLIELFRGTPGQACKLLIGAADDVADLDPERALYMLGAASLAAAYTADPDAANGVAQSVSGIEFGDSPVARFLAALVLGVAAHFECDYEEAGENLREAVRLADEADRIGADRFPSLLILAGVGALFLGDDQATHRFNDALVVRARESGAAGQLTQALPRLAWADIWAGRWASASASLREGLELAREIGQQQIVAHALCELGLLAALRGDEEQCRALTGEARELAAEGGLLHVENTCRFALMELALGKGHVDEAFLSAQQITQSPVALHAGLDRIEAAFRAGDTARAWLTNFGEWADAGGMPWARAIHLHGEALLADDPVEAERLFHDSLEAHAGATRPFAQARTELAYGEFLRRGRRRVDARDHLRAALDAFEALGAASWAARARLELRASGQTARRRDPSTLDELTPQELQIAGFVAQGLSNREVGAQLFLSPRTIDYHLRNVFRKLGISSRTELAALDLDSAEARSSTPVVSPVRV
jgi:ATP/maltotriose-dependent transcriptional regulator MalT